MSLQQLPDRCGLMKNNAAIHVNKRTAISKFSVAAPG